MAGYKTPPGTIVNTIKSLLKERYKQGFPIIKEIIQNANDGRATTLEFGIVRGIGSLNHPLLKSPALLFLNNGTFSKSDREAISCFGIDANAKDRGKIGKFGLGQKSIFHFCEAFFYMARSENIPEGCGEFINPWATSEGLDSRRPEWSELSEQDRQQLENYLITHSLVNPENLRYFLLWVPLRQRIADERCILANYYDDVTSVQESLPDDMEMRIGQLLPLLRHLRDIRYWIENDSGSLQQCFSVCLDDTTLFERCIYPDAENETIEPDEHELQGEVSLSSDKIQISFAGKERILAASDFSSLLGQNAVSGSNSFWTDLQKSSSWPKRSSINENAEEETVPDKSIPHCAVVFTKQPLRNRHQARLVLQWSVFLPLASDEKNSSIEEAEREAYQQISCDGDNDYTIFLHGYFFLDSGRKYIEGLQNIRSGSFVQKTPSNEDEIIAQWNYLLATRGTLRLLLPSLQKFTEKHSLLDRDISNLCQAISRSRLFENRIYRESVCAEYQWVFRTRPSRSGWELIPANANIRSLPKDITNWQIFPKLIEFAEQYHLILSVKPNLLSLETTFEWHEAEICAVLDTLTVHTVFSTPEHLSYLVDFLSEQKRAVSQLRVQKSLMNLLCQAFLEVGTARLQNNDLLPLIKQLVSLLLPEKRFAIASFSFEADSQAVQNVLSKLYALNLDLLLVYEPFESSSKSNGVLSPEQVVSILTCLSHLITEPSSRQVSRVIHELIHQVLKIDGSLDPVLSRLQNAPLFLGDNHSEGKSYIYTYLHLQALRRKNCLFKGRGNTAIANALKEALPNCEIVFIDNKIASILANTSSLRSVPECKNNSCLQLLATQPNLATPDKRTNLLKELIDYV